jgi:putative endonuclease
VIDKLRELCDMMPPGFGDMPFPEPVEGAKGQRTIMTKGYMYILECADGSYYTGSTRDLERRVSQHQKGEGAKYTRKKLPLKLVYMEEFSRIDEAYYREKQVQGWSRKKKQALISGDFDKLPGLASSSL